jgi:hypothetical protein
MSHYPYHHHHQEQEEQPPPQRPKPRHRGLLDPDTDDDDFFDDEQPSHHQPSLLLPATITSSQPVAASDHRRNSSDNGTLHPQIVTAYREAKARGLPDGWTCTIDVSNLNVHHSFHDNSALLYSTFSNTHTSLHLFFSLSLSNQNCTLSLSLFRNAIAANGPPPTMDVLVIPFPKRWPFRSIWVCFRLIRKLCRESASEPCRPKQVEVELELIVNLSRKRGVL